jgi:transposase
MLTRAQWEQIRELCSQGWSKRAIARKVGTSRSTVRRALASPHPPQRAGALRGSLLDGHRGWMRSVLENDPDISAARIHAMLTEERGVSIGASTVRDHVACLRPKAKRAYLTLHFAPGECAQADWGTVGSIEIDGRRRRLSLFVMVLAHSRLIYAELCLSEKMECWLAAHRRAFEAFGAVPKTVMVDNLKTAVTEHLRGADAEFNGRYLDLARHYGFRPVACTPYQPQQKGRVENGVGYIKKAFFKGRRLEHLPALREALSHWLETVANRRVHGTTGLVPTEVFVTEERGCMLPLPLPYDCCVIRNCLADAQFRVSVDGSRYSVPAKYASRKLQLRLYDDRVMIYHRNSPIAEHLRSYGSKQNISDPRHEEGLRERNRHGRREKQILDFLALGDGAEHYLAQLQERRPDWQSHVVRINALSAIHGSASTIRAVRDAAESSAYAAEYVHHLLTMRARQSPRRSPLHVTRGEDLLAIPTPQVNLNVYTVGKEPQK